RVPRILQARSGGRLRDRVRERRLTAPVGDYAIEYLDRGTDRLAVHVYPDGGGPVALVLPAMGVPARYYRPFAGHLRDAGLAVLRPAGARERYTAAEAGAPIDHFRWVRASAPLARRVARFAATR